MVKVEKGVITQTSLPLYGYIAGRFVSRMANHKEDLLKDGWYEPEHRYPEYDQVYEKLSSPSYSYDADMDKVYADYTVIEKPEAVMKKRIDELEKGIDLVADKTIINADGVDVATIIATIPMDAEYCFITVNGPPAEKTDIVDGQVVREFSAGEAGLYKVEFFAGNKTAAIIIEVIENA